MSRIEKTIVVEAPLEDVYAQWTQFEEFPRFMDGVDRVVQLDDQTLEWTATVAGREKRWTARIVDQTPDERIAWRGLDGAQNDGAVLFTPVDAGTTEIRLVVDADPEGVIEEAGDRLGFLDRRVSGDLDRFKAFIEERDRPTGSWDGEIHGDEVIPAADGSAGPESMEAEGGASVPYPTG
jgi:uncharacterized membrane protein